SFTYTLTATKANGQTENLGGGTLTPNDFVDAGIKRATVHDFEPFETTVTVKGTSPTEQTLRFVVPVADFPFPVTENLLIGLRVTGTLVHKTNGSTLSLDSVIKRNEVRTDGTTVLVVYPTDGVPLFTYTDYNLTLTVHPPEPAVIFDPFETTVSVKGLGSAEGVLRFVVPVTDFPFPVTENALIGLRTTGTLVHKTNGSTLPLDSVIKRNEVRPDGTAVLVIYPTDDVPLADYGNYNLVVTIHPPQPLKKFVSVNVEAGQVETNVPEGVIKLVVPVEPFPFPLREDTLKKLRVTGTLTHETNGTTLQLDSVIKRNEVRPDGTTVLVVSPTDDVPLANYQNYKWALTIHSPVPIGDFDPFTTTVSVKGLNWTEGVLRFVVNSDDFPFRVIEDALIELRTTGTLVHKTNGTTLSLDSVIKRNEVRADGTTVLVVRPTNTVPVADYRDYNLVLTIHPPAPLGDFAPFDVQVSQPGTGEAERVIRLVVPVGPFPFPVAENTLKGLRITGTLTHKTNGTTLSLDSFIKRNEARPDSTTVLVVYPTEDVPLANYQDYQLVVTIRPPGAFAPFDVRVSYPGTGEAEGVIRLVVPVEPFPFSVQENMLKGLRIKGTLTHKTNGSVLRLDSLIKRNEMRTNGTTVLVVYPTDDVPVVNYRDYDIVVTIFPPIPLGEFAPFAVQVNYPGMSASEGVIRLVVPMGSFPFPVEKNNLKGLGITGTLTHKTNGTTLALDSLIKRNEIRQDGTTVLVVYPTGTVPLADYGDYSLTVTIHPPPSLE
ncbi:hypothetical protein SAMN02799630_06119, partial [Paenibacillus sp. UNCCL117]|uniref:hypothetical protein n=2 Tax=unclassified Paenibacillus TaxID=185978 RepID=UPI000908FB5A